MDTLPLYDRFMKTFEKGQLTIGRNFLVIIREVVLDDEYVHLPSALQYRSLDFLNYLQEVKPKPYIEIRPEAPWYENWLYAINYGYSGIYTGNPHPFKTGSLALSEVFRALWNLYPFGFLFKQATKKDNVRNQFFFKKLLDELLASNPSAYENLTRMHKPSMKEYVKLTERQYSTRLEYEAHDQSLCKGETLDVADFALLFHYYPRFELAEGVERCMIIDTVGFAPPDNQEILVVDVYDVDFHFAVARLVLGFLTERGLLGPEVLTDSFNIPDEPPLCLGLTSNLFGRALHGPNEAPFKRMFITSRVGYQLLERRQGPARVTDTETLVLDCYTTWHSPSVKLPIARIPRDTPTFWR